MKPRLRDALETVDVFTPRFDAGGADGRPTRTTAADPRFVDYYGRPWPKNREQYFEVGRKARRGPTAEILDLITQLEETK
jgi:hypothetical protein